MGSTKNTMHEDSSKKKKKKKKMLPEKSMNKN